MGGAITSLIQNHHFVYYQIFSQKILTHARLSNLIHQPTNLSHLIISRLFSSLHIVCMVGDVKATCYWLKMIPSENLGNYHIMEKWTPMCPVALLIWLPLQHHIKRQCKEGLQSLNTQISPIRSIRLSPICILCLHIMVHFINNFLPPPIWPK